LYATIQILASLLILTAFVAALTGRLEQSGYTYLSLNLVGSSALAVEAAISAQWGFLLLEGVWAAVSLGSIARNLSRPSARDDFPPRVTVLEDQRRRIVRL
jgi:hypothetical protein